MEALKTVTLVDALARAAGLGHGGPAHSTTQDALPTTLIQHIPGATPAVRCGRRLYKRELIARNDTVSGVSLK
jgi:hypothetical protein